MQEIHGNITGVRDTLLQTMAGMYGAEIGDGSSSPAR